MRPQVDLTITKADSPDPVCAASWPTTANPSAKHLPSAPTGLSAASGNIPAAGLLGTPDCLDGLTYHLVVGNSGNGTANNVEVRDPLPSGLVFDSYSDIDGAGFKCALQSSQLGNVVDCTGGTIGPASVKRIDLLFAAPALPGPITNTVTVDPNNAIFEADETNNSATQTTTVVTGIDLTVWKGDNGHGTPPDDPPGAAPPLTQGFDPIATNGTDTYTIIVGDVGTQNATGVTVRDTLPAGTKFLSVTSDHGFTCSSDGAATGGNVTCVGGSLLGTNSEFYTPAGGPPAPGAEDFATIRIKLFVTPAVQTAMHNIVRVDPDNQIAEANENNNTWTDDTVVTTGNSTTGRVQPADDPEDAGQPRPGLDRRHRCDERNPGLQPPRLEPGN